MKEIKIPISNKKMILLVLGALAFVLIGIWFVIEPESLSTSTRNRNPYFTQVIGIVSIIFFGLCLLIMIIQLLDKTFKGVIINDKGIYENSSILNIGLIKWEDIKGFKIVEVQQTRTIIILTDKPKEYIDNAKSKTSKKFMELGWKMNGSPLYINPIPLKIKSLELEKILNKYFEYYKSK